MTLDQIRTYMTGVLKGVFPNLRTLRKISENNNGKMLFNGLPIESSGGSSVGGGSIVEVTTSSSEFNNKTVLLTTEDNTIYESTFVDGKAIFYGIIETGPIEISVTIGDTKYTSSLNISTYSKYSAIIDSVSIYAWTSLVGLSYTNFEDITEVEMRKLMTIHITADYLVSHIDFFIDDIVNSQYAMKWIGLRDYVCDKLMAIDEVKDKLLASEYWEYILKDKVPVMTSNTAPYGEVSSSNNYSNSFLPYFAFNGTISQSSSGGNWTTSDNPSSKWIQYKFVNPICINKISVLSRSYNSHSCLRDYTLQGSNDGSVWTDIGDNTYPDYPKDTDHVTQDTVVTNKEYYLYYRLNCSGAYRTDSNGAAICFLQFYGRSLNVSVPRMTSATAPYGEAFGSSPYSATRAGYAAFGTAFSDSARFLPKTNEDINQWYLGYKFLQPTCVKYAQFNLRTVKETVWYSIGLQGSNDGTNYEDIGEPSGQLTSTVYTQQFILTFNNEKFYNYYRFIIKDASVPYSHVASDYTISIGILNFYGVDYSEREFEEGGTKQYIYDHGVEVSSINVICGNAASVNKSSDNIKITAGATVVIGANINISNKYILRGVFSNKTGTNDGSWIGYSGSATSFSVSDYGFKYFYGDDILNAFYDVSSLHNKYPAIGCNSNSSLTLTEWWLE